MTGPPLAGLVFKHFGPQSPFFAAACVLLVAMIVAAMYKRRYGASFARGAA